MDASAVHAVILAGGLGTRFRSVFANLPKALAPIQGRPFMSYLLEQVQEAGVRNVIICTGHLHDQIEATFGYRHGELNLTYSAEPQPLGTGGALRLALAKTSASLVLVMNGDSYIDADLRAFMAWHLSQSVNASMLVTQVGECSRYGRVDFDASGYITCFVEKGVSQGVGWINAGVYLLPRAEIAALSINQPTSLEREVFPGWLNGRLRAYQHNGRFIDIGTPESYEEARAFFAANK